LEVLKNVFELSSLGLLGYQDFRIAIKLLYGLIAKDNAKVMPDHCVVAFHH